MKRFDEWLSARTYALSISRESGLDVSIRKASKDDRPGFIVSYASKMDSDYARHEIVRPTDVL